MRTETRTVRIGERVGNIDWSYDFRAHFDNMATTPECRAERCEQIKGWLRTLEDARRDGKPMDASTYGGYPRIFGEVLDVGMYDGWPYWKPVPSVLIASPLGGGEWSCFAKLTDIRERRT